MPQETDPFTHPNPDFRSGFVALLGQPNVGKSTLLNALLKFKIAIVSPKAQTTRDRISGIFTNDQCQIVFVDTPGVMEPRDLFNESLRDGALEALDGADAVYHLIDAGRPHALPAAAQKALSALRKPVFLLINKTDVLENAAELHAEKDPKKKRQAAQLLLTQAMPENPDPNAEPEPQIDLALYRDIFFISAIKRTGLKRLREATRLLLPPGPLLFDADTPTDRNMRFLASEIVREKVLQNLEQEVPYAVATQTDEFVEREPKYLVRVIIYVEHESQKGILIGGSGSKLGAIGRQARPEIEELADHPIYLELWVKVRKNWRKKVNDLREFGYRTHNTGKKRRRRKKK